MSESVEVWEEPVRGASFPPHLFGLSGIDQLRAFLSGRALPPPIRYLTGMMPTEVGMGSATFTMPITGWLRSPQGPVVGGAVAILADGPLGSAIQSTLPPATPYTTSELSLNLVRPVPGEGILVARGRLVHGGRRLALSEVFITDSDGRLIAHGTSRCVILPSIADLPAPSGDPAPAGVKLDGWVPPFERPPRGEIVDQSVFAARSGLDVMRAHVSGDLPAPPLSRLFGSRPTDAGEGTCTFVMPATGWLCSPSGFVEGGVIACLADIALGGAVQTTLPAGSALAPTDLRVQFIRPVQPDGRRLEARAMVVHRGRSLTVARADIMNAEGKLAAIASGSAVILPGRRADLRDAPPLG
jgi:uncharacterized protein (TIGR00369 family)